MPPGYPGGPDMAASSYGYPPMGPGPHHMGPGIVPRHSASPGLHPPRHRATPDRPGASPGHTHSANPAVVPAQVVTSPGGSSSPGTADPALGGRSPVTKTTSDGVAGVPPADLGGGEGKEKGKVEEEDARGSVSTDSSNATVDDKATPRPGEEKQRAERDKVTMERQAWYRCVCVWMWCVCVVIGIFLVPGTR